MAQSRSVGEAAASVRLRELANNDPDGTFADDPAAPLTYREFDRAADRVAAALIDELGTGPLPVAIRTAELRSLAVAALGVSRAGKTVVVIDPDSPEERFAAMLDDLGCGMFLADAEIALGGRRSRIVLDYGEPGVQPRPVAQARTASIQYTSGSTGVPKGVMIPVEHRDALGEGLTMLGDLQGVRAPFFIGNSWGDALVHAALLAGATLVPYNVRQTGTSHLRTWLRSRGIGVVAGVPTLLRALLASFDPDETLPDLRIVVSNGETLQWSDVAALRRHTRPDLTVINMFGLTESGTIAANFITRDTPIGRGAVRPGFVMPSVEVEIVGEDGHTVPVGSPGEIVVTSNTTMLGYWQRDELTAKVLTHLPDGRRRLHTGDGGRLDVDGTLIHHGRIDHVVKIAGHRVELGEIETALASFESVAAAAAASYEDAAGDLRLAAFVVTQPGSSPSPLALRADLRRLIPTWMLPDRVVIVDELPRLANGKVDRKALPNRVGPEDPLPADGLLGQILSLYRRVLDRSDIGPDDSFFDAGGDSIRAASLFVAIAERLGHDRSPSILLDFPTARMLAQALEEDQAARDVLSFNVGGQKAPLIVIHDGSGDAAYTRRLAEDLGPEQPVYAIRGRALDGVRVPYRNLEQLSASYIDWLLPLGVLEGPVHLCGFSLGGMIAFEMALQLQERGYEVATIFAGDTMWPEARQLAAPGGRASRLRHELSQGHIRSSAVVTLEHLRWRVERSRETLNWLRARRLYDGGGDIPIRHRYYFALYQYGIMAERYVPASRFSGRVILLRALGFDHLPDLGWGAHTDSPVEIEHLDCHHVDVCRERGMSLVAGAISRHI